MSHPQAEVFWQIPHCQDREDDKFLTNAQGGGGGNGHTWNLLCHYNYNLRQIFFLLFGKEPSTWPANNCLQIMVCSCATSSNCVWLWHLAANNILLIHKRNHAFLLAWKWQITLLPEDIHGDQMIKQLLNSVIAKYRDLSLSSLCTDPPPLRKNQRSGICESPSLIVYVNNFTRIKNSFRWPKILWLMFHVIPVLKMLVHETYIVFSSSNWKRETDF